MLEMRCLPQSLTRLYKQLFGSDSKRLLSSQRKEQTFRPVRTKTYPGSGMSPAKQIRSFTRRTQQQITLCLANSSVD